MSSCSRPGASQAENTVVAYLDGAELQAETDAQRQEVYRALTDLLEKTPAELRQARYADTQGAANRRTIVEVIRAHFVPPRPVPIEEEQFTADASTQPAKDVIRRHRDKLGDALGIRR
jgi:hypothetical protein